MCASYSQRFWCNCSGQEIRYDCVLSSGFKLRCFKARVEMHWFKEFCAFPVFCLSFSLPCVKPTEITTAKYAHPCLIWFLVWRTFENCDTSRLASLKTDFLIWRHFENSFLIWRHFENKWFSSKSGIGPLYYEAGVVCARKIGTEILFDALTSGVKGNRSRKK